MLVSTSIEVLDKRFGRKEAIRLVAEAGFDAYDLTLCSMSREDEFLGDNWRELAQEYRRYADSLGIVCNQSHAPMPSSFADPEQNEARFQLFLRALEIASIAGAKSIVIHPVQHLAYVSHVEELKQKNKEFFARPMPYAEKFGVKIATENMWQVMKYWVDGGWEEPDEYRNPIVDGPCATGEEFAAYIDQVDSPYLVACLDLGHAVLAHHDPAAMIRALGPRLQALHVHDVDGKDDLHTAPFVSVGVVDFDAVTTALAEIDYQGDITFEALRVFSRVPEALIPQTARYLYEIGRYLADEVERKKK